MKSRWIAAGAAACALALLTVPMLMSGGTGAVSVTESVAPADAVCKDSGMANYDFVLKDQNGGNVRMADYKGKVLLLNFWGTWCGPCRREIPALMELQNAYRDKGFVILGVAFEDTAEAVRDYAAEMKINYPLAMAQNDFEDAYGPVYGLPLSLFVARDGSICKKHIGEITKERAEQEIKALL